MAGVALLSEGRVLLLHLFSQVALEVLVDGVPDVDILLTPRHQSPRPPLEVLHSQQVLLLVIGVLGRVVLLDRLVQETLHEEEVPLGLLGQQRGSGNELVHHGCN
jgi:hypothetical protein